MTDLDQKQLGKTLWNMADTLRGATDEDVRRTGRQPCDGKRRGRSDDRSGQRRLPVHVFPRKFA